MGTIAEMFIRKGEERGLILGRQEGMKEGELKSAQEMLIRSLRLRFEIVSPPVKDRVRSIQSLDTVNDLFELSFKCSTIEDFNEYLTKIMDN